MNKDIQKIAEHCGPVKQAGKLIEEMAELMQAICKYLNAENVLEQDERREHIYEEMADVGILWEQLAYLFKANDKINEIAKSKTNRTLLRLGIAEPPKDYPPKPQVRIPFIKVTDTAGNGETNYEQGLTDAWEAARKIICEVKYGGFTREEIQEIFGETYASDIMVKFTASEAIAKIKEYEGKQKEIKVGDELEFYSLCAKKTIKGVVYQINYADDDVYLLWTPQDKSIGGTFTLSSDDFFIKKVKKTGRHFPQVEELLKAMKEK